MSSEWWGGNWEWMGQCLHRAFIGYDYDWFAL